MNQLIGTTFIESNFKALALPEMKPARQEVMRMKVNHGVRLLTAKVFRFF
jgi:hypothetical protein